MSKNEDKFRQFLDTNKIEYKIPQKNLYSITNVPFNKTGIYKPDFYLPDKNLYIEIKGFMTLFTINKLFYLLEKKLPTNFCILQMTDEDWIRDIKLNDSFRTAGQKIQKSIELQFNEIKCMSSIELHNLSLKRLNEYVLTRKAELTDWLK